MAPNFFKNTYVFKKMGFLAPIHCRIKRVHLSCPSSDLWD